MASVSSPPHDALDLGPALMEVIIETAVSFSTIWQFSTSAAVGNSTLLVIFCTVSCQSGAFRCSNGTCILSSRRCDGNEDCTDGSDEMGCGKLLNYPGSGGKHAMVRPYIPIDMDAGWSWGGRSDCNWWVWLPCALAMYFNMMTSSVRLHWVHCSNTARWLIDFPL